MLSQYIFAALLGTASVLAQNATSPTPAESPSNATATDNAIATITGKGISWTDQGNGTIVIGGKTITPGDPVTTISGYTISVATDGIVLDGETRTIYHTPVTLTFREETITASEISKGVYQVYTATLTSGGPAQTVLHQEVSAGPDGLTVASFTPSAEPSSLDTDSAAGKVDVACSCALVALGLLFFMVL